MQECELGRFGRKAAFPLFLGFVLIQPVPSMAALIVNYGDTVLIAEGDVISEDHEVIGDQSDGTVNQTGGSNTTVGMGMVSIGHNPPSTGTYNLSGGELGTYYEHIGYSGTGTLNQSGGTNRVEQLLSLGYHTSGSGVYNMSGGELSASVQRIGIDGTGVFNQSGGTNTISGLPGDSILSLGVNTNGIGSYTLSGNAQLIAPQINVGLNGTGYFTQNSGTNTATSLVVARNVWSSGTYELNGGSLLTQNTTLGLSSDNQGLSYYTTYSTFNQSGGTHAVDGFLVMGRDGGVKSTYNLSGGALSAYKEIIGDTSWGLVDSTLTYIDDGSVFTQTGGTNTVATQLVIADKSGSTATYELVDGSLSAANVIVGNSGNGSFVQLGGTNTITYDLILGFEHTPFFGGTYTLAGGALSASYEQVGYRSDGFFTQSGGTNRVSTSLVIGTTSNGNGTYELSGGSLEASAALVGSGGVGAFNQLGGTSRIGFLAVGSFDSSIGNYNLSDGELFTGDVFLGRFTGSTGTFTQTGGLHEVSGTLHVASDNSQGAYRLGGGTLTANVIDSFSASADFIFTGGTLNARIFEGDLVNSGGTLNPGASPGLLEITGDYTQDMSAMLMIELGGLTRGDEYDALLVNGALNLGGILNIVWWDGFTASEGDVFDILDWNTLVGTFDDVYLPTLTNGLAWNQDRLYLDGTLSVRGLTGVDSPPIIWLMVTGLLYLAGLAGNRKPSR